MPLALPVARKSAFNVVCVVCGHIHCVTSTASLALLRLALRLQPFTYQALRGHCHCVTASHAMPHSPCCGMPYPAGLALRLQPFTYQAFEGDGLDWNEFGVMLAKEDIPKLHEILKAISPEEIQKKQEAMERVKLRFIWGSTTFNPFQQFMPQEVGCLQPASSSPVCKSPVCSSPVCSSLLFLSCLSLSCLFLSCLFSSFLSLSCLSLPCLSLPCPFLSCLFLSCLFLPCPFLSCLFLSCLFLSCLLLSCLLLSCLSLLVLGTRRQCIDA